MGAGGAGSGCGRGSQVDSCECSSLLVSSGAANIVTLPLSGHSYWKLYVKNEI